ncbi:hypothetical protein [Methylobacterium nodulans]|uniref:Uncharacterized protein n=1 Tax=Methylobacterium nodulans (strain LMG 21967 / CNCM I-2342 / ORS 2060) TaxID=460265 RepID=B8IIU6_METNO|nr:hypothetical protein [Methylobacterium nodulans]ACL61741.1 hypothetical protein Mnod_6999 [Methylobacterium nodulans ORS 2060]
MTQPACSRRSALAGLPAPRHCTICGLWQEAAAAGITFVVYLDG